MDLKYLRIVVQLLTFIMGFAGYFLLDMPGTVGTGADGTIEARFIEHNKTYTQTMNLGLYSAYSWPSIATVFSGVLIDRILGRRKSTLLFSGLTFLGALFFWIGTLTTSYGVLVFSRILLGFGSESVCVVQSAYITRWMRDQRLGLSICQSLAIAFLRLATASNFLISPVVSESSGVATAAFIGVIFAVISGLSAIGLVVLDLKAATSGQLPDYIDGNNRKEEASATTLTSPSSENSGEFKKQQDEKREDKLVDDGTFPSRGSAQQKGPSFFEKIRSAPMALWVLCLLSFLIYTAMFPFIGITENFFQVKYGMSHTESSRPTSVYEIVCAIGLLFSGFAVDLLGRHTYWLILSSVLTILVFFLFLATSITPYVPMLFFAVAYFVMVSAMWSTPPFLVDESLIGIAYGSLIAALNVGIAVFNLIVGAVLDNHKPDSVGDGNTDGDALTPAPLPVAGDDSNTKATLPQYSGYEIVMVIFLVISILSLMCSLWLWVINKTLTSSPAQRKVLLEESEDKKRNSAELEKPLNDDASSSSNELRSFHNISAGEGSSKSGSTEEAEVATAEDLYSS